MIKLTRKQLEEFEPCGNQVEMFGKRKSMNAKQAFEAGATIRDLCWVAQKLGRKDLLVKFALKCAQDVAHLNTDPRAQVALNATQAWIDNPSEETRRRARIAAADAAAAAAAAAADAAAADAAATAAYAAYAAAAAADVAATASAAAYAAYDAAATATAAAYATYDAAAAARKQKVEQQKQWFVELCD